MQKIEKMKYKYLMGVVILGITAFYIISCHDMNYLHDEYIDQGQIIYPAKIDSLKAFPGNERLTLEWLLTSDRSITTCIVYWDEDSVVIPVSRSLDVDTIQTTISGLAEGNYVFKVFTMDENGNRSMGVEKYVEVYGESYQKKIANRLIEDIVATGPYGGYIEWANPDEGFDHANLNYVDSEGNTREFVISSNENETEITDFIFGGYISYQSYYIPAPGAIDTFVTNVSTKLLPSGFIVDKEKFNLVVLPTDIAGDCYGHSLPYLWNGIVADGDWYHSGCSSDPSDGVPHHFTVDLGAYVTLNKIILNPRQECCQDKNPKVVQLWGTDDITDAETTLYSNDPGWEDEALSKGWIKLLEAETGAEWNGGKGPFETDIAPNESVRFIRLRIVETWDGGGATFLSEMSLYANSIED